MAFNISDKVVCVNDQKTPTNYSDFPYLNPGGFIEKGKIYAVRGIFIRQRDGKIGLQIVGKPVFNGTSTDCGWNPIRFRLIQENSNTVSLENKLTPAKT